MVKNANRQFPTEKEFTMNKQKNDIIYGFYQTHSYLDEKGKRFCWKGEVNAAKIIAYFKEVQKGKNAKEEGYLSEPTIRKIVKVFEHCGLLIEGEKNRKKIYYLADLEPGKYIYMKTETLSYLVDTATTCVIKVYAYLKMKWQQHIDFNFKENYLFTRKELLEMLGLDGDNHEGRYLKLMNEILDCLINNGLIEVHAETKYFNMSPVPYLSLDKVNDDYIHNLSRRKKKDDNEICPYVFG